MHVDFNNALSHVVSIFLLSLGSMSHLRNGHVAVSSVVVKSQLNPRPFQVQYYVGDPLSATFL